MVSAVQQLCFGKCPDRSEHTLLLGEIFVFLLELSLAGIFAFSVVMEIVQHVFAGVEMVIGYALLLHEVVIPSFLSQVHNFLYLHLQSQGIL